MASWIVKSENHGGPATNQWVDLIKFFYLLWPQKRDFLSIIQLLILKKLDRCMASIIGAKHRAWAIGHKNSSWHQIHSNLRGLPNFSGATESIFFAFHELSDHARIPRTRIIQLRRIVIAVRCHFKDYKNRQPQRTCKDTRYSSCLLPYPIGYT